MSEVVLGRAGDDVLVDLDVCAKTGQPTTDRASLRGTTTPTWVVVLLLFTVVGFLVARSATTRRYRVTVPFVRDAYDSWRRNRRLAWIVGIVGLVLVVLAIVAEAGTWLVVAGLALVGAAVLGGSVNGVRNGLGVSVDRSGDLVLGWAHPRFAEAVQSAQSEMLPR